MIFCLKSGFSSSSKRVRVYIPFGIKTWVPKRSKIAFETSRNPICETSEIVEVAFTRSSIGRRRRRIRHLFFKLFLEVASWKLSDKIYFFELAFRKFSDVATCNFYNFPITFAKLHLEVSDKKSKKEKKKRKRSRSRDRDRSDCQRYCQRENYENKMLSLDTLVHERSVQSRFADGTRETGAFSGRE